MEKKIGEGKIAVITGASSGIGEALGRKLQESGYTIVNLSLTDSGVFENFYEVDISSKTKVDAAFKKIGEKFGRIDLLVNNAGFGQSGALEFLEEGEIRKIFDVNSLGVMFCTNAALPFMTRGAKIANTASVCALFALPFRNAYCASKAATHMLSLGYRLELRRSGIDVVSICPGDVRTNFTKNRQSNFKTNERYGDAFEKFSKEQELKHHKRMSVDYVVKVIVRQLSRKKMPPFFIIGAKYKFLYFAHRIVPMSWFLHFTNRMFNKPSKDKV